MKMRYLLILLMTAVSAAMSACGGETNVNVRTANNTAVNRPATPTMAPTVDCNNVNMSREDYDKNKAQCEKNKGTSTIGQGINDSWIWFKTRAALLAASDLRESTINVDVTNDVITLKGTYPVIFAVQGTTSIAGTIDASASTTTAGGKR